MKNKPPYLSYFFGFLFLAGFLTLFLSQSSWESLPDSQFPFYAEAAIVSLIISVVGMIVEIIRYQLKKK